jgi:predicted GIY-YIG superfamily endonuclease
LIPLVLSLSKDEYGAAMTFWTCILRCADGSYMSATPTISRGESPGTPTARSGCTSNKRPVASVFAEASDSRDDACRRERQIKGWSRAKKEALGAYRAAAVA